MFDRGAAQDALSRRLTRALVRLALFQTAYRAPEPDFVSLEPSKTALPRIWCALGAHEFIVHCAPGTIHLRCLHCGARTRGWDIAEAATPDDPSVVRNCQPAKEGRKSSVTLNHK